MEIKVATMEFLCTFSIVEACELEGLLGLNLMETQNCDCMFPLSEVFRRIGVCSGPIPCKLLPKSRPVAILVGHDTIIMGTEDFND